jgi:GntR family transcriptional regulator/MocR family aminotransferase
VSAKSIEDSGAEVLGQIALADFLARGQLDRHLRRMRLAYAQRRRFLLAAVADALPALRARGDAAGVFELLELPAQIDEPALLAAAARRGVGLEGLSLHRAADDGAGGVLAGYAALPDAALRRAVELLSDAFAEVASA